MPRIILDWGCYCNHNKWLHQEWIHAFQNWWENWFCLWGYRGFSDLVSTIEKRKIRPKTRPLKASRRLYWLRLNIWRNLRRVELGPILISFMVILRWWKIYQLEVVWNWDEFSLLSYNNRIIKRCCNPWSNWRNILESSTKVGWLRVLDS